MSNWWTWWTSPTTGRRYWDQDQISWLYGQFTALGLSDNAVCGLFGNLYWESGICPMKCEGIPIVNQSLNETINRIRPATRSEFIAQVYNGGTGYSLAQWSYVRKGDYYDWPNPTQRDVQWAWLGTEYQIQRDGPFLIHDLQQHPDTRSINENIWSAQGKTVWQWLSDPGVSLDDALNAVLMLYEKPWSSAPTQAQYNTEFNQRRGPAGDIMQDFAGLTPPTPPTPPPTPPGPGPVNGLPIWLYFKMKEMNGNAK